MTLRTILLVGLAILAIVYREHILSFFATLVAWAEGKYNL